ncbi:MAG: hypothetical protein D6767_10260 [Candidatus Hydrogenedentota bacterium]|nr:MAG: hypothetical protein D6767_10260 [Candidatus Hydrogenedentota bacterium]
MFRQIIQKILHEVQEKEKSGSDANAVAEVLDNTPQYLYDLIQLSIHASKEDYVHLEEDIEKAIQKGATAKEVVRSLARSKNELFSFLQTEEERELFSKVIEYLNQKITQ